MASTVKLRNVVLGEGVPKICVPLTDTNLEELKQSVKAMENAPFDLVEWRADFYNHIENEEIRREAMAFLRDALGEVPILFTLRTSVEGGKVDIDIEEYLELLLSVVNSKLVDLVDVELSRGDDIMQKISATAHSCGIKLLGSLHDFRSTPSKDRIIFHLRQMQQQGADIVKYAVTPECARDVLTLLDATLTMHEEHPDTPVITMSMGGQGTISRVSGSVFGSCITFGTVGKSSAPGQLPVELLTTFLKSMA